MGIIDSGILGGFRNKTGPVSGRKHMGQDVITSAYRKSKKPLTPAQLYEQEKLGMLSSFLNSISMLTDPGFKKFAKKMSAVNAAVSYNYPKAFLYSEDYQPDMKEHLPGLIELNYPALVYSRGDIASPDGLRIRRDGDIVTFSWAARQQSQYCQHTDLASVLVYFPQAKRVLIKHNAAQRHQLGLEVKVPHSFNGLLHCYISFTSADEKITGNSKYAGWLEPVAEGNQE
ncbi:DUF6266 family protein [Pedobacter deserti]|uniref:DUF6266 family protein n=1 Tax=Pedobacter deserti TaxID=2817382 RepID=UPI00210C9452|nr:DUF6266 family protein [Pedobacter sp. SYSU D00382]